MPKEGYKAVTIPDDTYNKLREFAESLQLSIPELIGTFMSYTPYVGYSAFAKYRDLVPFYQKLLRERSSTVPIQF